MRHVLLLLALAAGATATAADPLATVAERSAYARTGRYDEVVALCAAFSERWPKSVRCERFGTTPEGRPMLALVANSRGVLDAEAARARAMPVLLAQGGIHAGEIDGKDAGFALLRDLLSDDAAGWLAKNVFVFVPVFNVDGHERFGRWNRPNQRGPEEMGWRTTAQGVNLNRDYAKADAPEMRAMLALLRKWDPIVYADLHVTNGAQFRHDIAVMPEPLYSGDAALRAEGVRLRDDVLAFLAKRGSRPLPFYPSFRTGDDPASGFDAGAAPPRFSSGYLPLRNRWCVLVETHSWKDYATRVRGTKLLELAAQADARAARLGGATVPLEYLAVGEPRTIEFLGYAYTRTMSDVSGATMTRYDESQPVVWRVPYRDDVRPSVVARAPKAGYVVPAAHAAWLAERLDAHGIRHERLGAPWRAAPVATFRATNVAYEAASFEGRQRVTLEGEWRAEARDVGAGALFVPIAQPLARLVVALLEPRAPDSFAAWGMFNHAFERKEYMEDYVTEAVAREMLAKDPALKSEFERRLQEDEAFAKNPAARLEFFYRRHASWDERNGLYPVYRSDAEPRVGASRATASP
jgi:hypothetical protein